MIYNIRYLGDHRHRDLIKYCQNYENLQVVPLFFQKTKGNTKDSDW